MPVEYLVKFNNYVLPGPFVCRELSGGIEIAEQARTRRSGSVTSVGRRTEKRLAISGRWTADTFDAFWAKCDEIIRAVDAGPGTLWFGRDDRYYKEAQLIAKNHTDPFADGRLWGGAGQLDLTFTASRYPEAFSAGDPYEIEAVAGVGGTDSINLPISYGPVATTKGDAATRPTWTIEIDQGGTGDIFLLVDDQVCVLTPVGVGGTWADGDVVVLPSSSTIGLLNGAATPGIYDRKKPLIYPSTIAAQLDTEGTVTLHRLAAEYPGRWI